ncbi:MAG: hypothetical protein K940chlam7_00856 [Chlamydiae bacterium]|nr:hypothetical protein [Chlamydiota bacterium]
MIKKYFFTGLALLLPVVITVLIINFFINLLTKPFQNVVEDILSYYGLLEKPILFFSATQVLHLTSKLLIIVTLIFITVFVGLLTRMMITRYFIHLGDYIIDKIPFINKIYKATQEVIKTLFSDEKQAFSQVVLVPFPHNKAYSLGMITREDIPETSDREHQGLVSVFVPATPNPTMGYILLFKRNQLVFLDMKVEDALKTIISCGVIFNNNKKKSKSNNHE